MSGGNNLRNSSLDTLKCICAFCVVFIHFGAIKLDGNIISISQIIDPLTKIAVPIFFMITGYYYNDIKAKGKTKKYIIHIITLTITATLFYFFLYAIIYYRDGHFSDWFSAAYNNKNILKWVLINEVPVGGHLWYLYALIYAFIILSFFDHFKLEKTLNIFSLTLIVVYVILNFTYLHVFMCNFIFLGLPFISLGRYINKKQALFLSVKDKYYWSIITIGFIMVIGENVLLYHTYNNPRDIYLCMIPIVFCIFCLAIKHPLWGDNTLFATIGRKYSTYIYIYHIFIATLLNVVNYKSILLQILRPYIVFWGSVVFAMVLDKIKTNISNTNSYYKH